MGVLRTSCAAHRPLMTLGGLLPEVGPVRRILVTALISLLALSHLAACTSASSVRYTPEGDAYAAGDLPEALLDARPGPAASVTVDEAPSVRQEALADLRANGEDASALADTLTSEFPSQDASVPFAVELGTFEGEPAWIVFEAWSDDGERLSSRRVWVFSYEDRMVLAAHSAP